VHSTLGQKIIKKRGESWNSRVETVTQHNGPWSRRMKVELFSPRTPNTERTVRDIWVRGMIRPFAMMLGARLQLSGFGSGVPPWKSFRHPKGRRFSHCGDHVIQREEGFGQLMNCAASQIGSSGMRPLIGSASENRKKMARFELSALTHVADSRLGLRWLRSFTPEMVGLGFPRAAVFSGNSIETRAMGVCSGSAGSG